MTETRNYKTLTLTHKQLDKRAAAAVETYGCQYGHWEIVIENDGHGSTVWLDIYDDDGGFIIQEELCPTGRERKENRSAECTIEPQETTMNDEARFEKGQRVICTAAHLSRLGQPGIVERVFYGVRYGPDDYFTHDPGEITAEPEQVINTNTSNKENRPAECTTGRKG